MDRLYKNTAIITLAYIMQKLIAFFYFSIISKAIGVESTGEYFLALAIITVVAVLADMGVTPLLVREVAKSKDEVFYLMKGMMAVKMVAIPLAVAILIISPVILGYDVLVSRMIWLGAIILIADSLSLTFYGVLRGLQLLKFEAAGMMLGQFITSIIGISALYFWPDQLIYLIVALSVGSIFNLLFSASIVVKRLGLKVFIPDFSRAWPLVKLALAFFVASIFTRMYSYIDTVLLNHFLGVSAVGIYAVAYKLTYAFQFLPMAFVAALYPAMSEVAHSAEKLSQVFSKSIWYVSLLSFPIVAGIFSLAPEIIILYSSSDFLPAVLPLQILIFVLIFIFLDFPMGSILNATNRQDKKTMVMGFTMLFNLLANFILIPYIGITGAAISGLLSFMFMFFFDWYMMRDLVELNLLDIFKISAPFLFSAIIMSIAVISLKEIVHLFFIIPIGALIYVILIYVLGGLNKNHLKNLWMIK